MRLFHLRPHSFDTTFIWDLFIWDHIHLRDHSHLRPHSFETTFIWDFFIWDPHSFETTLILDHIHFTPCQSEAVLIYCESHFYDLSSTSSRELTLYAKTLAFVEITCQAFCSYAVAFLFSKAVIFSNNAKRHFFLVFHFSVKNWNYPGDSIKETGRNAKHIIHWLGLNYILEVQRSLPNPRYEEFSGLCGVLKCGQRWQGGPGQFSF